MILTGNVTSKGVEIRTAGEAKVARFSVVDFSGVEYKKADGTIVKREHCKPVYFNIEVWGKKGEDIPQDIAEITPKSLVTVTGNPYLQEYKDKEGNDKLSDIIVRAYKVEVKMKK